ncbi:MAG: class I SAM-dependent methyltransferase [Pseudomonadota bacterium]|nr:class I SAM-dependent methyltransferase [Pseudomonadota bacterium]
MKIIYDKENSNFGKYLNRIINTESHYRDLSNLELDLKKKEIALNNYGYKKKVKITVNFKNKENSSFKKIFKKKGSTILDCTAGFGRDSYILAKLGFDVTMIEKNPIATLMLNNGIKNLLSETDIYKRLKLIHGDSYEYLKLSDKQYDYIYIDFMFEKLKNTTLASKDDETLKLISRDKENRIRLLNIAKIKCRERVVVKNHIHNSSIIGVTPDYQIKTKLINYHIFMPKYETIRKDL